MVNTRLILALILLVSYSCDIKAQVLDSGSRCITPNQERATCIRLDTCPVLYDALNTSDDKVKEFLRRSLCGWETKTMPRVCCGTKASYTEVVIESKIKKNLLPDRSLCGFQDDKDKIIGGKNTALEEFPWMALLGYTDRYNRQSFGCGGALISHRYVLTAAHCINTTSKLTKVRLGEWNLNETVDCVGQEPFKYCIRAEDFEVESTKIHENYRYDSLRGLTDDIALIRLKTAAKFSKYIQPICLPTATDNSEAGELLWVAGWGVTDVQTRQKSSIKQKVQLPVVENSDCEGKFRGLGDITISDQHLCAGGELGKDSCRGDSGGPLMATSKSNPLQFYVEGVVSFGISCGSSLPGVYTRISKYLQWIENNITE